jgi:type VI secretion system protein ImpK
VAAPRAGARLIEAFDPLVVLVLQLQQTPDPGDGEALRARVNELLSAGAAQGRELGASEEAVAAARYALVALVDEVVLTSSWPLKDGWLGRPLQLEHFNSFAAGEEFFTRLEAVRQGSDPHRLDALEVFATCLCLGFRGKHVGVQGLEVLRGLVRGVLEELKASAEQAARHQATSGAATDLAAGRTRRRSDPDELSPAWRPPAEPLLQTLPKELPVRLVAVVALGVVLGVYLLLLGALRHGTSAVTGS